jgi:hypothetical protein
MRREIRRNEQYPVKLQPVPDFFSRSKVAVVNRVECSAEDAEFL